MFEQRTVVPVASPAESQRQERPLWAPVVETASWEWNLNLALEGGKSEKVHRPFYSTGPSREPRRWVSQKASARRLGHLPAVKGKLCHGFDQLNRSRLATTQRERQEPGALCTQPPSHLSSPHTVRRACLLSSSVWRVAMKAHPLKNEQGS